MLIKRETNVGANSILTVYRPCTIGEFVGNDGVKKLLKNYLTTNTLPHSLLFTGQAGSGKTTLAIAMMYHLLKDEYKAKISFEAYKLSFKFKRLHHSERVLISPLYSQ